MRKLDLSSYMAKLKSRDPLDPGKMIEGEWPYNPKEALLNLLFHPALQLTAADLKYQSPAQRPRRYAHNLMRNW